MTAAKETALALALLLGLSFHWAHAQSLFAPAPWVAPTHSLPISDQDALKNAAKEAFSYSNWQAALAPLERLQALVPEDAEGHAMRGFALLRLGRNEEAAPAYQSAAEFAPTNFQYWRLLCWAQILVNLPQVAQASCEKAVSLSPNNYAAQINLGQSFLLQGNAETARVWYQKGLNSFSRKAELKGFLNDFDLYICKGSQIETCREARSWFERQGEIALARWDAPNKLWAEASAEILDKNYAHATDLTEQGLSIAIQFADKSNEKILMMENIRGGLRRLGVAVLEPPLDLLQGAKVFSNNADFLRANARYEEALPIAALALGMFERVNGLNHPDNSRAVLTLANVYFGVRRNADALPLVLKALAISEAGSGVDHPEVAIALTALARVYTSMGRFADALPLALRAQAISEGIHGFDQVNTSACLEDLAVVYQNLGRHGDALPLAVRLLAISQKDDFPAHRRNGHSLGFLGKVYKSLGRDAEALPLYVRALEMSEKSSGPFDSRTAHASSDLASMYGELGRYSEALPLLVRALVTSELRFEPNHPEISRYLYQLAGIYEQIGRSEKAIPLLIRAVASNEITWGEDHHQTGQVVNLLADQYRSLGRYGEAQPLYERAFVIYEKVFGPDHNLTGSFLGDLADLHRLRGRYDAALPLALRSLAISEITDGPEHPRTATRLSNLALLHFLMGNAHLAEPLFQRAWRIASFSGRPEAAWTVQDHLRSFYADSRPQLAILYGKQAVNTLQQVRVVNASLDKQTQRSFLDKNDSSYKALADLLFTQGRLLEGQQVLAMLKEAEYFDFVQRSSVADPRQTQAGYTDYERPWNERYAAVSSQLAGLGKEREALLKKAKDAANSGEGGGPSAEDQLRKEKLDADLAIARQAFDAFMVELKREFTEGASAQRQQEFGEKSLASLRAMQGTLRDLGKLGSSGTVMVHYLITDKRLWILLTTPNIQLKREAVISSAELNRQIGQYRQAIASRDPNIKGLGKALYEILIAPIAEDLKQENAQTLMLSLDGSLRYLPMAALHDGEQYLAQRYRLSFYTAAAKDKLKDRPQVSWTLEGFGVTQKIEHFEALPSVKGELNGILQDMKGSVRLDKDFTAKAFKTGLEGEPSVVHLASHFVFRPGNETDSFLLMGDGKRLSLKEIKDGYEFVNLDLLTLSACETAVGGGVDANGREVEGFGALAQNQGAKGVIATLWPVGDQSTGQFMQLFYGFRQQNAGMTKAHAMQMAQRAFIDGRIEGALAQVSRGAKPVGEGSAIAAVGADTNHPYFWAPFILMGNWL